MTNRDDTADPTPQPALIIFPLDTFRQRLTTLNDNQLARLLQKLTSVRGRLGHIEPNEPKRQRLDQALRIVTEYVQTRYSVPIDPTAVDEGITAIDQVIAGG